MSGGGGGMSDNTSSGYSPSQYNQGHESGGIQYKGKAVNY